MKKLALLALLLVAGCAAPPPATNLALAADTGYQAALTLAVQYNALPRCGAPTSPPLCSQQAAVVQLRLANNSALAALQAFQNVVLTPGVSTSAVTAAQAAAAQALTAFQAILTNYGVK